MGVYSGYQPGASPLAQTRQRYQTPTYSAGTQAGQVVGYSPKGAPEAIQADQFLQDWGGVIGGIDVLARGPAYAYERPFAAADTLLSSFFGITPEQQEAGTKGVLDTVTEGISKLPVIGKPLSDLGAGSEKMFHYTQGSLTAGQARMAEAIWDLPDGQQVDRSLYFGYDTGTFINPFATMPTVGEVKKRLRENGWTDEDIKAMRRGEAGWFDYGHKKLVTGEGFIPEGLDAVAHMALDPSNLLFGAGLIAKSGKFVDWGARLATAASMGNRGVKAAGVTKMGFTEAMLTSALGKADNALKFYRNKVALPTTAGQIALNTVSDAFPEVKEIPFFGDVFQLAEDIGNNKPLSQGDLFMVASLLNFPARSIMREGYARATKPLKRQLGVKLERKMLDVLVPEVKGYGENKFARAMEILGIEGADDWQDFATYVLRTALNDKFPLLSIAETPTFRKFATKNIADLVFYAKEMQNRTTYLLRREFEAGTITPQDIERTMHSMVERRGGALARQMAEEVRDSQGRVIPGPAVEAQRFTPEKLGRTWQAFRPLAQEMSEAFGGKGSPLVPGIADNFLAEETIDWMQFRLRDLKRIHGDKMVPADLVEEILMDQPVVFKFTKQSNEIQRVLGKSTKTVDVDLIDAALGEARKKAFRMSEWTADVTEWENSFVRSSERVGSANAVLDENAQLRHDITPEFGGTEVVVNDAIYSGTRTGAPGHVDQLRALRNEPDVAVAEHNVPLAQRESGYNVDSAVQIAQIDGKVANSALSIRMKPGVNIGEAEGVLVLTADAVEAKSGFIIMRGHADLTRQGLAANAVEFVWEPTRRLSVEELDNIALIVRSRFGSKATINDTTGVVRVFVREEPANLQASLDLITQKLQVEPAQGRVHLREYKRKVGKNDKTSLSFDGARTEAGRDQRYWVAKNRISDRLDGPQLRGTDDVAGGRGRPGGPAQQPPGRGGSGAYRTEESTPLTRWESARGNSPRGSTPEFAIPSTKQSLGEFRGRVTAANGGERVRVESGSRLFILPDKRAGAWVTPGGELRVWSDPRPGRSLEADIHRLIAEASEHAVFLRVLNIRKRIGSRNTTGSSVDIYGEHGWRVVGSVKTGKGEAVYLLRDVAGDSAFPEIPPRFAGQGGYQSLREQALVHSYRSHQQASAMTHGNANRLYPDGVVERMPQVEREAMGIVQSHTQSRIEELAVQDPTNLAMLRARDILRHRNGGSVKAGGAVVEEGAKRTQGGAASDEALASIGMKRMPDGEIVPIETPDTLVLDTKGPWAPEEISDAVIADWDDVAVGLPKKGTPGNISKTALAPDASGLPGYRYIHYDDAGVPDGVLTFKTQKGTHDEPFRAEVVSEPFVVVRPDRQRQGIARRLLDQAEGENFDFTALQHSFTPEGRKFWESYTSPEQRWFYHGTLERQGEGIISAGMRPGNPNGNWTTSLNEARGFNQGQIKDSVPIRYNPIFRTKKPRGKLVRGGDEQVVAGSWVRPDDMQVSWDDGKTWHDVGALNARRKAAADSAAREEQWFKEWVEDYGGNPDISQAVLDGVQDQMENVNMGDPPYRWTDGAVLLRGKRGSVTPMQRVTDGNAEALRSQLRPDGTDELSKYIADGKIVERGGAYYWGQENSYALYWFGADDQPYGRLRFDLEIPDITGSDSAHGTALNAMNQAKVTNVFIDDMGGTVVLDKAMLHDALRDITDRVGKRIADQLRQHESLRGYFDTMPEGYFDEPVSYAMNITLAEDEALRGYSAHAAKHTNKPLREGQTPAEIVADPSNPIDDIEYFNSLDRATHRGVFPDDGSGEYITWRMVGDGRFGAMSKEYVDELIKLEPGDDIADPAYWSSSSSKEVTERSHFANGARQVQFEIHNKPGQKMGWMHHLDDEAEILYPRNNMFHVVEKKQSWRNPKGAPTYSMEIQLTDELAEQLLKTIDEARLRVRNTFGHVTSVEESLFFLEDNLRTFLSRPPKNGVKTLTLTDYTQDGFTELMTVIEHALKGVKSRSENSLLPKLPVDEKALTDLHRTIKSQFVLDEGYQVDIVLENLGDDWIDPVRLTQAVDDTVKNGGGTFRGDDMAPYDPEGVGGIAVAVFRDPETGQTTFRKLVGDEARDADKIQAAVIETRDAFPDAPYVGTWYEELSGVPTLHVGPTVMFPRSQWKEAFALAREKGQATIFDYDVMTTYPTPNSYNMNKGRAWVRANRTPRTPAQNARDYSRKRAQALKNKGKVVRRIDQELLKNEDTTLYLDDNGQTGVAVAPDGRVIDFFSVDDARGAIKDAPVPLKEVGLEVINDGRATHAVVPPYAVKAAGDLGLVPVAKVGDETVMVMQHLLKEAVDDVPVLATMEEAIQWAYLRMGKEPPAGWWGTRMADDLERWDGGLVRYIYDQEQEVANFHPRLDPSYADEIELLSPQQAAKVYAAEAELRRYKTGYTLKRLPEGGSPYWTGMGKDVDLLHRHGDILEKTFFEKVTSPAAQVWDRLWSPVYSRELSRLQQQHIYDEFLQYGATVGDVNTFNRGLKSIWEKMPTGPGGTKPFRRVDSLAPNTIRATAKEFLPPAVLERIEAAGDDIVDLIQRSGSRTYRYLSDKYPAEGGGGKGHLGSIIDELYGKGDFAAWGMTTAALRGRRAIYGLKTAYHIFRFLADPRWILMNWHEADFLALGRAGWQGRFKGRSTQMTNAQRAHSAPTAEIGMQSVEDILTWDAGASGWLDPRNLNGHIGRVFEVERKASTKAAIEARLQANPAEWADLEGLFGPMTTAQYADEFDRLLYDLDTKGAKNMVLDEAAANGLRYGVDALWDEFLENLWKQHSDMYRDIMHIFHGNVNRNNLERTLNSPLLWWPISYQLKAGKWVFDMLTDRFLGVKSDLLGAGYLSYAMVRHSQLMETNETYQGIFMDHPVLWRAVSMAFPMTPFDVGVFMARWTRYTGSWAGAQLGLWEQDPSYPQTIPEFVARSARLGPLFSLDLTEDLINELNYR